MIVRFDRFFLDEKDLILFSMGLFLLICFIFNISLDPFRLGSLVVLYFFMVLTRSMVSQTRFIAYMVIAMLGFVFSLFLSPYGLAIYLFVAMMIYVKTGAV